MGNLKEIVAMSSPWNVLYEYKAYEYCDTKFPRCNMMR
jgi:hypothetical protein